MAGDNTPKRHIWLRNRHRPAGYIRPGNVVSPPVQRQDRATHGQALLSMSRALTSGFQELAETWEGQENIRARGIVVEFTSYPNAELNLETFDRPTTGFELLNERIEVINNEEVKHQLWFIPDGRIGLLEQKFQAYLTQPARRENPDTPKYQKLVDSIRELQRAALDRFWTEEEPFPYGEELWMEVWLRRGKSEEERREVLEQFRILATAAGLRVGSLKINLPEHTVVSAYGAPEGLGDFNILNCLSELRRGRDYADFVDGLERSDQALLTGGLLDRVRLNDQHGVSICVLDTGINRGHPLLSPLIPESANRSIQAWPSADDQNHGTPMAGLCAFDANLTAVLVGDQMVEIPYLIEGTKIIPPTPNDDEKLAGAYTMQGIAVTEASNPERRKRIWCVATSMEGPNDGRPSSWSAAMDGLAAGIDNDGSLRRLICLAAGNVNSSEWINYPQANYEAAVENPAQAFNSLCVGAYTMLDTLSAENNNFTPIAGRHHLAPCSRTGDSLAPHWRNCPDLVLEGGNAGIDGRQFSSKFPELSLLTTDSEFQTRLFRTMDGTSAATALAARMAALIQIDYPDFWPETIRAIMVHSSEWTEPMLQTFPEATTEKERFRRLLRTVGYGVPSLRRACESLNSRATLIAQERIQPFRLDRSTTRYNEMHVYDLPWPHQALATHARETVRMRVTLSYFIEPNPGNRGYSSIYRYASCGLRFRVSAPGQGERDLAAQVSRSVRDELTERGEHYVTGDPEGWKLGSNNINKGSIHSDIWEGTAADLADMKHIAVYPITGWWRTRKFLDRVESSLPYSLIVTLESPNEVIDLYSEIEATVQTKIDLPLG